MILIEKLQKLKNEMPDTSKLTDSHEFNRSIKIKFDARMLEGLKNLATKEQEETALNLAYKNRVELINLQTFHLGLFHWLILLSLDHKVI